MAPVVVDPANGSKASTRIAFRVFNMKTESGRKKKIETFVAMLARGETVYPQKTKPERATKRS
jgi:hypothetical protein